MDEWNLIQQRNLTLKQQGLELFALVLSEIWLLSCISDMLEN